MRERDPVADDGAAADTARLDQVDGGLGAHRAGLGGDERELAIDARHAAGEEAVLGERPEQGLLALGPAEVGECGDVAVGCVRHVHRIARAERRRGVVDVGACGYTLVYLIGVSFMRGERHGRLQSECLPAARNWWPRSTRSLLSAGISRSGFIAEASARYVADAEGARRRGTAQARHRWRDGQHARARQEDPEGLRLRCGDPQRPRGATDMDRPVSAASWSIPQSSFKWFVAYGETESGRGSGSCCEAHRNGRTHAHGSITPCSSRSRIPLRYLRSPDPRGGARLPQGLRGDAHRAASTPTPGRSQACRSQVHVRQPRHGRLRRAVPDRWPRNSNARWSPLIAEPSTDV